MKKLAGAVMIAVLLVGGGAFVYVNYGKKAASEHAGKHDDKHDEKQQYTCPMHPQIISDKPGDCPICGMKLVPLKKDGAEAAPAAGSAVAKKKKTMYRSTMNANEVSDKPGKDSMGMEMVAFEVDEEGAAAYPAGLTAITVSPESQATLGMTFGSVTERNIFREIRTSAKIVPDETRLSKVTTKISGWVEKLYVNQTGQYVKRGDPLLTVYSQELLAAQQEYLAALKAEDRFAKMSDAAMAETMRQFSASARERLRLLDISDDQIERIRTTGKTERAVTIHASVSGYVTEKMVLPGQRIMMNDPLMVVTDLSRVWGEADVYEADLPYVRRGMPVEIGLSYWPDKKFKGRISFLFPALNPETRTLKARIEIANNGLVLRPEMYADAKLQYAIGRKTAVPESAVMRTGTRDYVYMEGEKNKVIPVEVKLGMRSSDGYYEIISGLKVGQKVVTSANFLIDSESSLKASLKAATGGGTPVVPVKKEGLSSAPAAAPAGHEGHTR